MKTAIGAPWPLSLLAIGVALAAYAYLRPAARPAQFQGWVEAYFIFVSPDEVGRVETLSVREGDPSTSARRCSRSMPICSARPWRRTRPRSPMPSRPTTAREELLKKAVGSQKVFDDAEAALRTAEARLNSARTRLDRRRVVSPVAGTMQEVYFRVGEMVQPGRPIVSLLPPDNVRVRFFVPQAVLPTVHIGDRFAVAATAAAKTSTARVSFISAQAEFTPPVIYSQEERARLVFRIEAMPEQPADMRVGQPVSVALQPAARVSHAPVTTSPDTRDGR